MARFKMMRSFPVMLSFSEEDAARVLDLRGQMRASGGDSLESLLVRAAVAECDNRGIVVRKSTEELAEEAIAEGDDQKAASILLEGMKSKLEKKAKDDAKRKALLEKAEADRKAASAKKPGKKAQKP